MHQRLIKRVRLRLLKMLWSIFAAHHSPHQVALGVSIGVFIGLSPTVGIQMVLALTLATLVGANRPAAVIPVWVTNPATLVPIYAFTYRVGAWVLSGPSRVRLTDSLHAIENADGWRDSLQRILSLGWDLQAGLWVGGLIVGLIAAVLVYGPVYFLSAEYIRRRKERREKKIARRDQKRAEKAARQSREEG